MEIKVCKMIVNEFLDKILSEDCSLNEAVIQQNGWSSMMFYSLPNWIETEWLTEAISRAEFTNLVLISYAYKRKKPIAKFLEKVDKYSLGDELWDSIEPYNILTNQNNDFIYFQHMIGEYYIICGPPDFMNNVFRYSRETAKKQFFDNISSYGDKGKREMLEDWNRYVIPAE